MTENTVSSEAKWWMLWGFHQEYDSEQEAREDFEKLKQSYESKGYSVWYARLFSPEGNQFKIA